MSDSNGHQPEPTFFHAAALGLDPAWRRRTDAERARDAADWVAALGAADRLGLQAASYSSVGLEAGVDVLLWRVGSSVDALERAAAASLREGLGRWLEVRHSFLSQAGPSQYVRRTAANAQAFLTPERQYLIVYPFTKSTDWYLSRAAERQRIMAEHMQIGRRFPMVRQALGYSFGLDSQDFVVAYDTDDLAAFGDLVRELRGSESRRATVQDTPVLLGVRRSIPDILELLGAPLSVAAAGAAVGTGSPG